MDGLGGIAVTIAIRHIHLIPRRVAAVAGQVVEEAAETRNHAGHDLVLQYIILPPKYKR